MKIHVLAELRQSIGSAASYELEASTLKIDGLEVNDLGGIVSTVRTDRGLLVSVKASGRVQGTCSRCLKPMESPVQAQFSEEYMPEYDADTGAALKIEDDDEFRIGRDFFLDLTEGLRQYLLMSEPVKPLCNVECKGLCPSCGADWNQGLCRCEEEPDLRWKQLTSLTQQIEGR
jgi:uncharacterized protein